MSNPYQTIKPKVNWCIDQQLTALANTEYHSTLMYMVEASDLTTEIQNKLSTDRKIEFPLREYVEFLISNKGDLNTFLNKTKLNIFKTEEEHIDLFTLVGKYITQIINKTLHFSPASNISIDNASEDYTDLLPFLENKLDNVLYNRIKNLFLLSNVYIKQARHSINIYFRIRQEVFTVPFFTELYKKFLPNRFQAVSSLVLSKDELEIEELKDDRLYFITVYPQDATLYCIIQYEVFYKDNGYLLVRI